MDLISLLVGFVLGIICTLAFAFGFKMASTIRRWKRGLPPHNDFERNVFEVFKEEIEKEKKRGER
jgi:hypothetical protein